MSCLISVVKLVLVLNKKIFPRVNKQNNALNTMSICFLNRTKKHVDLSAFLPYESRRMKLVQQRCLMVDE